MKDQAKLHEISHEWYIHKSVHVLQMITKTLRSSNSVLQEWHTPHPSWLHAATPQIVVDYCKSNDDFTVTSEETNSIIVKAQLLLS